MSNPRILGLTIRWPWALLEGVQTYAPDPAQVEIARTITTLSGIEAIVIDQQKLETMNATDCECVE